MVELYNVFFVPYVYNVIQYFHAAIQTGEGHSLSPKAPLKPETH